MHKNNSLSKALLVALLVIITSGTGCIDISGKLAKKRDEFKNDYEQLRNEVKRNMTKLDRYDSLRMEKKQLELKYENLLKKQNGEIKNND